LELGVDKAFCIKSNNSNFDWKKNLSLKNMIDVTGVGMSKRLDDFY
jgi:hypothetical protein